MVIMKKIVFLIIVAALLANGYLQEQGIATSGFAESSEGSGNTLRLAYENRQSDIQVRGTGTVIRLLPDDLEGARHQKFILEIDNGQTLLISQNIDLAPRISGIRLGDTVEFHGEYEWNAKGGVIHWTHRDPDRVHTAGWLKHRGRTYQ